MQQLILIIYSLYQFISQLIYKKSINQIDKSKNTFNQTLNLIQQQHQNQKLAIIFKMILALNQLIGYIQKDSNSISNQNLILEEQKFYSFEKFFSEKENLSNFSYLSLCFGQYIGNDQIVELGQQLMKCRYTKNLTIDLSQNNVSLVGFQSLQKGLNNCLNLENLVLFFNNRKINPQKISCILQSFQSMKNLTNLTLNLNKTNFDEECTIFLGENLAKCSNLINLNLDLGQNQIRNSTQHIGKNLVHCKQLEQIRIWLDQNSISDDGISNFLEKYPKINVLQLYLANNRISFIGAASLSQQISEYKRLSVLVVNLYQNQVGKFGKIKIKRAAYKLPRLVNSNLLHC
ncbi:hypothetical protein TTHERM_000327319 (macronuclear) [Tetrahymena thermophila SB210]|uniref:Kinase domain protein n=1 Tax=Tetrahymena thermophila (strain SB210) TaxID=312017 RepID=W7X181_TETTS|nr:hypothetical protein TTHERM_000327319 [Tetrahymena thermophila SB210]EWS71322.1 hypothetical protein TTHERM_000327319 [Tetrahymena thermophila SB210]|eukprot:XP_012656140.1 hypothetical protein TTHERM_000327319 [Tetrahymena thermophila SB210]